MSSPDSGFGQSRGGSQVRITPDERNNTLLIKASGAELRKILGILRRIDQPPMQVLINATLAEVTLNDNLKYGVQVFLQQNGGKGGGLGFSNGDSIEISPSAPGLNFIVGNIATNPKVVLDALSTETAVRVGILAVGGRASQSDRDPAGRRRGPDHDAPGDQRHQSRLLRS